MENEKIISGILEGTSSKIVFTVPQGDFKFDFYTDTIYNPIGKSEIVQCNSKNQFLWGKTHDNFNIAIYYNRPQLELLTHDSVITSSYIISSGDVDPEELNEFDGIVFKGDILNRLFDYGGRDVEHRKEGILIKYSDKEMRYVIQVEDEEFEIVIQSYISGNNHSSVANINGNQTEIVMNFKKSQSLINFYKHYNKLKDLLCFMIFRDDIFFDEIMLLRKNEDFGRNLPFATVFMREKKYDLNKNYNDLINFDDLKDILPNIVQLLYSRKEGTYSYNFGFLPKDEKDVYLMTNTKIRAIASALECELDFIELDQSSKDVNIFVKEVSNFIKGYKKTHKEVPEKFYNIAFSSLENWKYPASNMFCKLYHEYDEEMKQLNQSSVVVTDQHIIDFVQYRNHITHGRHKTLNIEVAHTAHILSGLVYCAFLTRMGINRELLRELCKNKMLK